MIVIADTSPINYLILIGHIDVLAQIYGQVLVPQAVWTELRDPEAPADVQAWATVQPEWLQISDQSYAPDRLLDFLDRGERDAILLAEAIHAERLIIDDLDGRREAEKRNLRVIGTLGILAEAARRKLLNLSEAVAALQKTNFHAAPALLERLLANESGKAGN